MQTSNSETTKTPTCHLESLGVAASALFLHSDATLVRARVGGPGGAELVLGRGVCGGGGVDLDFVPNEDERVRQVLRAALADFHLAAEGDRGPRLDRAVGPHLEVHPADGVPCKEVQERSRPPGPWQGSGPTHSRGCKSTAGGARR